MRWSDDRLKSNYHRVRMPRPSEYQGSRYSIAYFNQVRCAVIVLYNTVNTIYALRVKHYVGCSPDSAPPLQRYSTGVEDTPIKSSFSCCDVTIPFADAFTTQACKNACLSQHMTGCELPISSRQVKRSRSCLL